MTTQRTLPEVLIAAAETNAAANLVFDTPNGIVETNVGRILSESSRVAASLSSRGIGPGSVVAVQLPNRQEAAVAFVATLMTGATLMPLVHIYGLRETIFTLKQSGASAMILPDTWHGIDFAARVPQLRSEVATLSVVSTVGKAPEGSEPWAELLGEAESSTPNAAAGNIALLSYTSGTTADPKGVQLTHSAVIAEMESQPQMLGAGPNAVQLASFPCGHVAGVMSLLRPLVHGTPTVVMDGWEASRAFDLIDKYRVTYTAGTPLHLATLLDAIDAGAPIGSLREYLVGAATVPAELVARAERSGITAFRSYGSTEHPTISSGTKDDPLPKRQYTDGRPTRGTEVRILDESGVDVPAGVDGEIVCRGPEQMLGYRDSRLDHESYLPGRWFRTGDIGNLDQDGYLTITDRAKDVIIRAGETISSREVEDVLLSCPGVVEAAAIAVPDPYYGEKVGAVLVLAPGSKVDIQNVRRHFANAGLARQKTPEFVEVREDLPRTSLGKVRKSELRSEIWARLSELHGTT